MKMILKKSFILIIILILFNATFIDSFAGIRKTEATYKINTLSDLKDELNLHNGNVYSDITKDKIIKETDPAVLKEYADEKIKQAIFVLNSINLDDILEEESEGTYIWKKTIDLGEGSKLIIELEDKEDRTLFSNIKDFFIYLLNFHLIILIFIIFFTIFITHLYFIYWFFSNIF